MEVQEARELAEDAGMRLLRVLAVGLTALLLGGPTVAVLAVALIPLATGIAFVIGPTRGVSFKGNGNRDLPPFTTRHGGLLAWTNGGDIFQIYPKSFSGGGDVNSQAHRVPPTSDLESTSLGVNAVY